MKTTCATAIARELYGDDWREHFLELNASDERGIDVVRDRIKNFARTSFGGVDYRIIFLDEADSLTSDAQSALRRTMEQFSDNTRFILSCNYSSKIIDPIQSRCAVFRFSPLGDDAVAEEIRTIAAEEDIELTEDGLDALVTPPTGICGKPRRPASCIGQRRHGRRVGSVRYHFDGPPGRDPDDGPVGAGRRLHRVPGDPR